MSQRIAFVVDLAERLHSYGTTAQRLEGAVDRVAKRLGLECEPWVNPTGMILAFSDPSLPAGMSDTTRVMRLGSGRHRPVSAVRDRPDRRGGHGRDPGRAGRACSAAGAGRGAGWRWPDDAGLRLRPGVGGGGGPAAAAVAGYRDGRHDRPDDRPARRRRAVAAAPAEAFEAIAGAGGRHGRDRWWRAWSGRSTSIP